ncbi:MAG TPA: hypothetical protein DHW02_20750 [Ktedonobacter sp.]|nr:hypothetical protein [Ktedonobacter sp.]
MWHYMLLYKKRSPICSPAMYRGWIPVLSGTQPRYIAGLQILSKSIKDNRSGLFYALYYKSTVQVIVGYDIIQHDVFHIVPIYYIAISIIHSMSI